MSYRSLKHVLGETSLERKCRILFGVCLFFLITGSFWWYGTETEQLLDKQNEKTARLLSDTAFATHHWDKLEQELINEGRVQQDFREDLLEPFVDGMKAQYEWSFIRSNRTEDSADSADAKERELWQQFTRDRPQVVGDKLIGEDDISGKADPHPERGLYVYYQPLYARVTCLDCHGNRSRPFNTTLGASVAGAEPSLPFVLGDLIGIVKVEIPYAQTRRDLSLNRAVLLATAIVTVFLAMIASYVIVRYIIVKPLQHLRDVSDAISHGDTALRADIHTGDEFEALAVAFNRMLRHLVAAQDELRQLNVDLDAKVDELAQMNMRLFEMNRLKSDFLATMSHELRTPLNSIIGFSDVLGSIASLDDRQKRYVQNIQKSGKVLLDMINDILDLAKIESGKAEVRLSDFRIGAVVGAQCDMARPLTEKKNIDLESDLQPGLPELHQDQGKVQQILNNLLSNAIKFTPEGGRIMISARRDDAGLLELKVADTGVGIAEEDQQHIFEKFRQGKAALPSGDAMTREYSGSGLGLSIVKELCKLLGGEVSLESELGKGSTFTIRLPWSLVSTPRLEMPEPDTPGDTLRRRHPSLGQASGEFDGELAAAPAPQAAD